MSTIEQDIEKRIADLDIEIARLTVERNRLTHGLCVIRGQCGDATDEDRHRCTLPMCHAGKRSDGQWTWK